MDVKKYMEEDLEFIENLVKELDANIEKWDAGTVLKKAGVMFDAFNKRFALEDMLLRQVTPTAEQQTPLKKYLKIRNDLRENLENILMLHVDEPDFHTEISKVVKAVSEHMAYLKTEFEPKFVDRIPPAQMAALAANLENRIRALTFS